MNSLRSINLRRYSYAFFVLFLFASGFSISVSQAALGISAVFFLAGVFNKNSDIIYTKSGLEKYILVFVVVSFILAFLSPNIIGNLDYIRDFWLIFAFVLAYSLHNSKEDIIKTIYIIIIIVFIQSVLALLQYYFKIHFADAVYYGLIQNKPYKFYNEWRGSFLGMHLVFSCYMIFLTLPLLYLSFTGRRDLVLKWRIITWLTVILSLITIFVTHTKSILVALPFAVIPLIKRRKAVAVLLIAPIIIFALLSLTFNGRQKTMIGNLNKVLFEARSSKDRIKIWKTALRVWERHPVTGSGGGNYLKEFKMMADKYPEDKPRIISHAHNDYINQLARKGIIGFLAFIYMLFGIFKYFWTHLALIKDRSMRLFFMGLFGAYCTFLVASLFQCFYTDEEDLVMFWFIIGFGAAIVKTGVQNELSSDDNSKMSS